MKLIALTSLIYELMMNIVCERGSLNFRGNNFVRWNFWCIEHLIHGPHFSLKYASNIAVSK